MNQKTSLTNPGVNWRQTGLFLLLTFALSWGIDLALLRIGGYGSNATVYYLHLQMLVPAFSAILLSLFFFKDSPLYFRSYRERPRWFFFFFLGYTLVYAALAVVLALAPSQAVVVSATGSALTLVGLMVLVALRAFSGREAFARAGLVGGHFKDWVLYGGAFVLYYCLQIGLNAAFGLGKAVDVAQIAGNLGSATGTAAMPTNMFFVVAAVQSVLVASLVYIPIAFGEEYGWRSYLQGQLIRLGKKRGILLLGLIWSVWHYPAILMGHNYPGYPLPGVILMTVYITLLAFVLGYVMLKTGSIWLVAFLHAINNNTYSFLQALVYTSGNPIFSFGPGLYGLPVMAIIVLLILRDPIWQDEPALSQTLQQPAAL